MATRVEPSTARPTPIDEIVGLLALEAPAELQELKRDYPEYARELEEGIPLGEPTTKSADVRKHQLMLRAARRAIAKASRLCDEKLPPIRERLRGANRLKFIAQIVSVVSSAAILTELSERIDWLSWISTFGLAALALVGSLVAVFVERRLQVLRTDGSTLWSVHAELVAAQFAASTLKDDLEVVDADDPQDHPRIRDLVTRVNEVAHKVHNAVLAL